MINDENPRFVNHSLVEAFAKENEAVFFEISTKYYLNVSQSIQEIVRILIKKIQKVNNTNNKDIELKLVEDEKINLNKKTGCC